MSKSQKMLPYYYIIIYFIESAIDRKCDYRFSYIYKIYGCLFFDFLTTFFGLKAPLKMKLSKCQFHFLTF